MASASKMPMKSIVEFYRIISIHLFRIIKISNDKYSPAIADPDLLTSISGLCLLPFVVRGLSQAIHVGTVARTRPNLVEAGITTWSCFDKAVLIASIILAINIVLASRRIAPASG